ncbi:hypothetical protein BC937DRAFT_87697 [Endogone sp. FLAS-F59071]|nr:hypothetical protein BC937DRAFT_87697 [Endogone sp. FLAS-F59071]|eukprot:RUS12509.1 hypothetical protein BC937DRAFT_87697 [Endogone sp. FLAS-F59071]
MTSFLQQFDFTIGAPASLFDLSHPLEPISSSLLQTMINAPQPPLREDGVLIAWMVSNCSPQNQRNDLMQSLMAEMEVHSFGKCMNNKDIPLDVKQKFGMPEEGVTDQWWGSWQDIKRSIFSKYPFVFTPENSNCEGYVTEKVYDALAAGSIPIYLGARDIEYYVPPRSIINVQNFENVKALVEYLKEVVNSTDIRMEYYKWKEMVVNDNGTFCSRCLEDSKGIECSVLDYATWL